MEELEQTIRELAGTEIEPEELVRLQRRLREIRAALGRLDLWLDPSVEPLPTVVMEDR